MPTKSPAKYPWAGRSDRIRRQTRHKIAQMVVCPRKIQTHGLVEFFHERNDVLDIGVESFLSRPPALSGNPAAKMRYKSIMIGTTRAMRAIRPGNKPHQSHYLAQHGLRHGYETVRAEKFCTSGVPKYSRKASQISGGKRLAASSAKRELTKIGNKSAHVRDFLPHPGHDNHAQSDQDPAETKEGSVRWPGRSSPSP